MGIFASTLEKFISQIARNYVRITSSIRIPKTQAPASKDPKKSLLIGV